MLRPAACGSRACQLSSADYCETSLDPSVMDDAYIQHDPSMALVSHALGLRWTYALLTRTTPILGTAYTIAVWSIHGPFDIVSWEDIAAEMRTHVPPPGTPILIGADWNSIPDPLLDPLTGSPTAIPWSTPAAAIAPTATVDLFRLLRPDDVSWTFARTTTRPDGSSHVSARRLDSIWGSPDLLPLFQDTSVVSTSSDHRAVGVSFANPFSATPLTAASGAITPYRPWSLHPGLWNEPLFISALDHFAPTLPLPRPRSTQNASPSFCKDGTLPLQPPEQPVIFAPAATQPQPLFVPAPGSSRHLHPLHLPVPPLLPPSSPPCYRQFDYVSTPPPPVRSVFSHTSRHPSPDVPLASAPRALTSAPASPTPTDSSARDCGTPSVSVLFPPISPNDTSPPSHPTSSAPATLCRPAPSPDLPLKVGSASSIPMPWLVPCLYPSFVATF
ncbi:hypothetical protein CF336_g4610 [Tilletia laevis]|nr:hypothetical protein CF336_g4610 [Tilletia laevis]